MASYLASGPTGADWFSRSGAVMCLLAAAANFTLVKIHLRDLAGSLKDAESSRRDKAERILKPPEIYTNLARISYLTGFLGTAIWGYGDPYYCRRQYGGDMDRSGMRRISASGILLLVLVCAAVISCARR